MYPYILIYAITSIMAALGRSKSMSRLLAVVFAMVVALFAGTRYRVGCDFTAYESRFNGLQEGLSWGEIFAKGEAGFYLLSLSLRTMDYSHLSVLFAAGIIYLFCLWRFSNVLEKPLGFLALAFPVLIVQLGMSGIRQALAVGFLVLAYGAFTRKRWAWVFIWVVVASQFHTSAIIFLPLAYLAVRQVSLGRIIAALVILGPVVGWMLGDRAEVYSARYVEQIYGENSSGGAWFRYILIVVPFLLFEWKKKAIEVDYPSLYPLLRIFSLITLAMFLVGFVSSVALHRLIFYAMPVSIVAFLCVSQVLAKQRRNPVWLLLPFFVYAVYMAGWMQMSRHASLCYDPYQTWLF